MDCGPFYLFLWISCICGIATLQNKYIYIHFMSGKMRIFAF